MEHRPADHGPEFWSSDCREPVCVLERRLLTPRVEDSLRARIIKLENDLVLWQQAGEAWELRAPVVTAAAEYMALLEKQQREILGDDYEAIMAELEQSTTGSQELADLRIRLMQALKAIEAAG
jgi:hypothetical protein